MDFAKLSFSSIQTMPIPTCEIFTFNVIMLARFNFVLTLKRVSFFDVIVKLIVSNQTNSVNDSIIGSHSYSAAKTR